MMNGFKRTFWTSLHKKKHDSATDEDRTKPNTTPTRFGFFSNPSTPRSETRPGSVTSTLRCQSWSSTAISTPSPSSLHCKTSGDVTPTRRCKSPLSLLSFSSSSSTPSSPNFSLLKSKLCFSTKSTSGTRCGICLQTAKSGKGTAIFTAECSHIFHFSCVASNSGDRNLLSDCPVCGTSWIRDLHTQKSPRPGSESGSETRKSLRVYNDDEPLITSPISPGGFNTIHEEDDEEDNGEFRGFPSPFKLTENGHVEVTLCSDSAIVAVNKGHVTSTVTLKIKSPPLTTAIRSPVDLVTVLDVSGKKNIETVKKSMKVLISSLKENDRLSIVSFSSSSKRLTPLKRMTANGKRVARRIVEEINGGGDGMSVHDAVKKAVKVIEDRRQKNVFTTVFVLTDRDTDPAQQGFVSSMRVSYLDVPKHTIWVGHGGAFREDAFAKRVESLLRFSVQDLTLKLGLVSGSGQGEITSVYSLSGRQDWFGSGLIRLSDMYSDEVREVLVEVKSPASSSSRSHRIMTVQSRHVDPTTQEVRISEDRALLIPRPIAVRSSTTRDIVRLRNRHVSTRAVAESRRLLEAGDFSGAERMLTSARALLVQYGLTRCDMGLRSVDNELENLSRMRGGHVVAAVKSPEPVVVMKNEPLTPTSAWRAAERLAKVAIMRKHMNRVSDLHGFENARF